MKKEFDLTEEELAQVVAFSRNAENEKEALTNGEIDDLENDRLTIGLMVKARRLLALIEIKKNEHEKFVLKDQMRYYLTRPEIVPIEEASEVNAQMVFALFKALEKKGLITEEELRDSIKNLAEVEVLSG